MAGKICSGFDTELCAGLAWQCETYCDAWKSEVFSVYGDLEPSTNAKDELLASGKCLFDVEFSKGSGGRVVGRFHAPVAGVGKMFLDRRRADKLPNAVISTTHPLVDPVAIGQIESMTHGTNCGAVMLSLSGEGVEAVLKGHLRVDVEAAWVSFMRVATALEKVTEQRHDPPQPTNLQYLIAGKIGLTQDRLDVNKHTAEWKYMGQLLPACRRGGLNLSLIHI